MTPSRQTFRHLRETARAALLFGCLCFLVLQQLGSSARLIADTLRLTSSSAAGNALFADTSHSSHDSLSIDPFTPANEAILTEKRALLLSTGMVRSRHSHVAISTFHNNCRPVLLRTRAVYCDSSLLRFILHPHLSFLAHTTTVLC